MKLKIFAVLVLCLFLAGFSTAQEIAFEQKVRLIETFDDSQEVIDPYVYPQLAARDKQRLILLTTYIIVEKDGKVELSNCFKPSEVDIIHFNCQICSLMKTKAKIYILLLGPGSGVSIVPGEAITFKANRHYEVSFTLDPSLPWQTGIYEAFFVLDYQKSASAVGGEKAMTFRVL